MWRAAATESQDGESLALLGFALFDFAPAEWGSGVAAGSFKSGGGPSLGINRVPGTPVLKSRRRALGDGPLHCREQRQQADRQQQEQGNAPAPWKGFGHNVCWQRRNLYGDEFLMARKCSLMKNEPCRLKVTGAYRYSRNAGVTPGTRFGEAPASESGCYRRPPQMPSWRVLTGPEVKIPSLKMGISALRRGLRKALRGTSRVPRRCGMAFVSGEVPWSWALRRRRDRRS